MVRSIYISPRVIDTITSLPDTDRKVITEALSLEFILGGDPFSLLTPVQGMIYTMIRHYVEQDSARNSRLTSQADALSSDAPGSFRAVGA